MQRCAIDRRHRFSLQIRVLEQFSNHPHMALVGCKVQCSPLVQALMVQICYEILQLVLIQQPLYILNIAYLG